MSCLKKMALSGFAFVLWAASLHAQPNVPPSRSNLPGGSAGGGPSFSRPAGFEDVPVYRIVIAITTANVSDAGTDDAVYIKFNNLMAPFWLNLPGDDRERNHVDRYDIVTNDIQFVRDIKDITIVKAGNDGWAIKTFELIINNQLIYQQQFDPLWIDGNDGHQPEASMLSNQLRASSLWNYNGNRATIYIPPRSYSRLDLKQMVASFTGNDLKSRSNLAWGDFNGLNTQFGDDVEIKFRNSQTLEIDLDLKNSNPGGFAAEEDEDYDLTVACNASRPTITTKNGKKALTGATLPNHLAPVGRYLTRAFTVPNCNAHYNADGSLQYW